MSFFVRISLEEHNYFPCLYKFFYHKRMVLGVIKHHSVKSINYYCNGFSDFYVMASTTALPKKSKYCIFQNKNVIYINFNDT